MLEGADVSPVSFQIAGGIVLFLFALILFALATIFGASKHEQELASTKSHGDIREKAAFPLAIPSVASTGAMLAVVVLAAFRSRIRR